MHLCVTDSGDLVPPYENKEYNILCCFSVNYRLVKFYFLKPYMQSLNLDVIGRIVCFLKEEDQRSMGQVSQLLRRGTYPYMTQKEIFMKVRRQELKWFFKFKESQKEIFFGYSRESVVEQEANNLQENKGTGSN